MPSGMGAITANALLDQVLGGAAYTPPTTVYLALFLTPPTATGGGTEVSGPSYVRIALPNNTTTWSNANAGTKYNLQQIVFPGAGGDWGIVVGAAIFDAPTGGNVITFGTVDEARAVHVGDTAQFDPGAILIAIA